MCEHPTSIFISPDISSHLFLCIDSNFSPIACSIPLTPHNCFFWINDQTLPILLEYSIPFITFYIRCRTLFMNGEETEEGETVADIANIGYMLMRTMDNAVVFSSLPSVNSTAFYYRYIDLIYIECDLLTALITDLKKVLLSDAIQGKKDTRLIFTMSRGNVALNKLVILVLLMFFEYVESYPAEEERRVVISDLRDFVVNMLSIVFQAVPTYIDYTYINLFNNGEVTIRASTLNGTMLLRRGMDIVSAYIQPIRLSFIPGLYKRICADLRIEYRNMTHGVGVHILSTSDTILLCGTFVDTPTAFLIDLLLSYMSHCTLSTNKVTLAQFFFNVSVFISHTKKVHEATVEIERLIRLAIETEDDAVYSNTAKRIAVLFDLIMSSLTDLINEYRDQYVTYSGIQIQ